MCGIYGTTKKYSEETIQQKLKTIEFRGPDYSGYKQLKGGVTFGHNRLAIIDLDARSHQPMQYERYWIVYNGEVYNFESIKKELQQKGYAFRTNSDTEVILAAYMAYGKDCVNQFNGMFAFVIYDTYNATFFGARDRMGQKPFYYTLVNNHFEFASQIYPISLGNQFELDETSIQQYLHWKCIIEPNSIYKEIKKLKAGHYFTYHLPTHTFKEEKYWDIDEYVPYEGSYRDATEELNYLIKNAVQRRMISDVPLGVFLSGGIDSSLVAAMAQASTSQTVKTFSVKFEENSFDESQYAQAVAKALHTDHTTILCNYEEGIEMIDNLVNTYQEPFADSSAIPTSLLSKYTRNHVTVALSGDAGDESFLGYDHYARLQKINSIYAIPGPIRKIASLGLNYTGHPTLKKVAKGIACEDINDYYIQSYASLSTDWLMNPKLSQQSIYNKWVATDKNLLERSSDLDLKIYLTSINTKVDRASMAYSLESRAPLEDYRVVAFARSLPTHFKYHQGIQKRILKDVLYKYLPKSLFNRPKMGFGMPLANWFRGRLKDYLLDTLHQSQLAQIPGIRVAGVQQLIKEHLSGKNNHFPSLWALVVLVNWMKKNG